MDDKAKSAFDKLIDESKAALEKMRIENVCGNYRDGLAEFYRSIAYADAAEMVRNEFEEEGDGNAPVA